MSVRDIIEVTTEVIAKRDANEGYRKGAMVVGRSVDYGLVRVFGTVIDKTRSVVRPFRRLDEAMAWLGLPDTLGDPFETMNSDQ